MAELEEEALLVMLELRMNFLAFFFFLRRGTNGLNSHSLAAGYGPLQK